MITIHVSHPQRPDVTRQLVHLAGGDRSKVLAATAGVTVDDALALAWLSAARSPTPNGQRPTPVAPLVQEAELRGGIGDPDAARERAAKTTPPAAGSGRRSRKTTAAPPEE